MTSRSKRTRLTLTACSQSGAHQEAPFGIYIPGSRRETGWITCQARHLDSIAPPAAPTALDHADQRDVALQCASLCAVSAATCALARRSEALACCEVLVASDWIRPKARR